MQSNTIKILLGFSLVFISGAVVGASSVRLFQRQGVRELIVGDPQKMSQLMLRRLKSNLDLAPEQIGSIEPIVIKTQARLHDLKAAVRSELGPRIEDIIKSGMVEVKPFLSAGQQQKLDEHYARQKARFQEIIRSQ